MGQLCTKANDVGNGGDLDTATAEKNQQGNGKPSKKKKKKNNNNNDDDYNESGDSSHKDSGERQGSDDSNHNGESGHQPDETEPSSANKSRKDRKTVPVDDDAEDDNDAGNPSDRQQPTTTEDGYKPNGTGKNIEGLGLTSGKSHKKYSPGDVFTAVVAKAYRNQDPGLGVEHVNGKFYVAKVGGLFATTPAIPGDKILTLNAKDYRVFKDAGAMNKELRTAEGIFVLFLRRNPDASQSSASSCDSDSDGDGEPDKDNGDESTELY